MNASKCSFFFFFRVFISKIVVAGGGAAGCSAGATFANMLCKNDVTIIDPSEKHYYQAYFTLIGGGLKTLSMACRTAADVLPKNARWVKDAVAEFDPKKNTITTVGGQLIKYDLLLVTLGLELRYQDVSHIFYIILILILVYICEI